MNHTYRLVWNEASQSYVPAAEGTRARKKSGGCKTLKRLSVAAASIGSLCFGSAYADPTANLPTGGQIVAGDGSISQVGTTLTVQQRSSQLITDWQSFDIGAGHRVTFTQPGRDAVALNRVLGNDPSRIYGQLDANGRVFLVNTNGILFGESAQVNVGGLIASTLNISNEDFLAGRYMFRGDGDNAYVINDGVITADGGAVALLGGTVSNHGLIQANLGSVALAAGNQVTLDFAGDGLIQLTVDEAALNALAENHQLIRADGGSVLLNAKATDALLQTVVNNTGTIEARTLENREGRIVLLGGFEGGTVQVSGTLDASARPDADESINGGFIDTSGAHVQIADGTHVTTLGSGGGATGTWLIDPTDFTITAGAGAGTDSSIGADTLAANLASTDVELQTLDSGNDAGDIHVNAAVSWNAPTRLTLSADNNIYINAPITVQNAGGGLALNHGSSGDYYLHAPISFTAGSGGSFSINGNAYTLIHDVGQLQAVNSDLGGHHALANDIDASATGVDFIPIGGYAGSFSGVLDGLGHVISELTINDNGRSFFVGLFGLNTGTLRNIGLMEVSVTGISAAGSVAGALAGWNTGSITNSYASGTVTGLMGDTGGLVGVNEGPITDAWFAGTVSQGYGVGGLVGMNWSSITRSYASATVTTGTDMGGLVGRGAGSVTYSFHTGPDNSLGTLADLQQLSTFTAAGWNIDDQGGTGATWRIYEGQTTPLLRAFLTPLQVQPEYDGSNGQHLTNIAAVAPPAGTDTSHLHGALIAGDTLTLSSTAAGSYTVTSNASSGLYSDQQGYDIIFSATRTIATPGSASGDVVLDNSFSWDSGRLLIDTTGTITASGNITGDVFELANGNWQQVSTTLPVFSVNDFRLSGGVFLRALSGGGVSSSPWMLTDIYGVQGMRTRLTEHFALANDIDASGTADWYDGLGFAPIGNTGNAFSGVFDGLGHVISHLTIDRPGQDGVGLFGYTQGTLRNIGLVEARITGQDSVGALTGEIAIGGNVSNSFAKGTVTGQSATGGLVGVHWFGTTISDAWFAGIVESDSTVGGLVGASLGAITRTYADAAVNGNSSVGGLAGFYMGPGITSSFHTGPDNGNGAFKTSDELKQLATFADWGTAINDQGGTGATWRMYEGHTTPLLRAFLTPLTVTVNGVGDKIYDGTAGTSNLDGQYTLSDSGAIVAGNLSFQTTGANAGTYSLGAGNLRLNGLYSDQLGYDISYASASTYTIARKEVSITGLTAQDKEYDGTTTATVSGGRLLGIVGTDDVALGLGSATFDDKNAGTGKVINVRGSLSGNDANNYTLASNNTTTAAITPRALTLSATSDRRTYNGTTASSATVNTSGLIQGDAITGLSQSFDSIHAGQRTLAVNAGYAINDGNGGRNYTVTTNTALGTIDRAPLTLMPIELQRLYGTPFAFNGDEFEIGAGRLFSGDRIDRVRLTSEGTARSASPGSYAIRIADAQGVGLDNYLINYANSPSSLRVLGAVGSTDALADTLASVHERREHLDVPQETSPLIEVIDGGLRLPKELSSREPQTRP